MKRPGKHLLRALEDDFHQSTLDAITEEEAINAQLFKCVVQYFFSSRDRSLTKQAIQEFSPNFPVYDGSAMPQLLVQRYTLPFFGSYARSRPKWHGPTIADQLHRSQNPHRAEYTDQIQCEGSPEQWIELDAK
jgi:hypothetical protein